jgi:hypothetical protein
MSVVPKLRKMRIQSNPMHRHPIQFMRQRIQFLMHLREPIKKLPMRSAQFLSAILMVRLRLPQRIEMLRCAGNINIEFMFLVNLLQLPPQMRRFLGVISDVDFHSIGVQKVPETLPRFRDVVVVVMGWVEGETDPFLRVAVDGRAGHIGRYLSSRRSLERREKAAILGPFSIYCARAAEVVASAAKNATSVHISQLTNG